MLVILGYAAPAQAAPPLRRDYSGPNVGPEVPPDVVEPNVLAPAPSVPGEDPATPPEPAPPADVEPPAEPSPVPPAEDAPVTDLEGDAGDEGGFDFEVVDLTEDEEALQEELKVETKTVKGPSGVIEGRVLDSVSGEPLIGAWVEVIGTEYKTKTDFDGNYRLDVPAGTWQVRIRSDANEPRRFSGVVVADASTETINAELEPLAGAGQTVVVQAEMNRESEGARLLQRKESVGTRDLMSRDEIAKSGGGSAQSVARYMVGVSIVDDRYVFIRGLGHRYVNTLFDGARVPSPEPEVRTVPFDIFPSSALSAINIQKTFTPDIPADFSGGSIQLESREVPDELVLELGASIGGNTSTTFRPMLTNGPFAGPDAFGLGNIPRALPSDLPTDTRASRGVLDENFQPVYSPEEIERFGDAMYTDTRMRRSAWAPPDFGMKATVGYGVKPSDDSKIGFLAAAEYKSEHQTIRYDTFKQFALGQDGLATGTPAVDYDGKKTTYHVGWSGVGLVKYDIDKKNRLELLGFYSREADDETREFRGLARNVSGIDPIINTRIRYIMRSILLTRLGGRHRFAKANDFTIDWFGSFSQARRDDPAIREMLFTDASGDGVFRIDRGNDSGKQTFLDLTDNTESGAVNFTAPFQQWGKLASKFKFGAWAEGKQRLFQARRFQFQQDQVDQVPLGTGNIINDATIGSGNGDGAFYLQEGTRPEDNYQAHQEVFAGYAMIDLPIVRWFKVAGGARFEYSNIVVSPFDPFARPDDESMMMGEDDDIRLRGYDWLPSVSLIASPNDKHNVRLTGTQTLARPEFRELAPFVFTDFVGGADVQGNPELQTTHIWNADLRWEWFPSASEVISASVFYKHFDQPIEKIRVQAGSTQISSFSNADAANNVGFEVEGRKSLEFIWKRLRDLSLGANFTYTYSRVDLGPQCDIQMDPECMLTGGAEVSTNRVRPLQWQSPWVINAYLSYDNEKWGTNTRVLYNVQAPYIDEVGGAGLPDIYREPMHDLRFVFSQRVYKNMSMSLKAENILNAPNHWTQDGVTVRKWYQGAAFSLGLGWRL